MMMVSMNKRFIFIRMLSLMDIGQLFWYFKYILKENLLSLSTWLLRRSNFWKPRMSRSKNSSWTVANVNGIYNKWSCIQQWGEHGDDDYDHKDHHDHVNLIMIMKTLMATLSTAMGSIGRTGGSSSGIPVDMIGRMPFIVLHHDDDDENLRYYITLCW